MAPDRGPDSFLEDFSPLSQALVGAQLERREHSASASGVYITIENEKCFKCFDSAFAEGHGNMGISFALDEIRGMETFRNICVLAQDYSSTMSATEIKNKFFFGSTENIKIIWDYCILSKLEQDSSSEARDEGDEMQLEVFNQMESFYVRHKTFPAHMADDIMDLFRYYTARDVILEASKHLGNINDETQIDSDKDEMDTEMVVHDNEFDKLTSVEVFYQKFKANSGKDVFALFSQFQTDGVDLNKIDLAIMQKCKLFYQLEKKKGQSVNMAGLLFTEEESVAGWINTTEKDIKFKNP